MIHAASRDALADFTVELETILAAPTVGVERTVIATELYSVAALLGSQPRLRRSLGDASTDDAARARLGSGLLQGKISPVSVDIVAAAVRRRWSSPWDLTDALEIAGDETLLVAAEQAGQLDEVEDELFRFDRILQNSGELASALDESAVPAARRIALAESLLAGKVNPISLSLIEHAITSDRRRRLQASLADLLDASARRRDRSVAKVITASELTSAQSARLAAALTRIYGREISIRAAVDPQIQGGMVVRVGGEVIDGTVSSRLAAAREAMAG
jgi:F-type H+-transporting ATPase subunit delta